MLDAPPEGDRKTIGRVAANGTAHRKESLLAPRAVAERGYSWRQLVAIERPEERERERYCTADPHKRKVEIFEHGKTKLQLVSALQIDLDSWPEWNAWIGFMEAAGADADYFVERRLWTSAMEQAAHRTMREMIAMP